MSSRADRYEVRSRGRSSSSENSSNDGDDRRHGRGGDGDRKRRHRKYDRRDESERRRRRDRRRRDSREPPSAGNDRPVGSAASRFQSVNLAEIYGAQATQSSASGVTYPNTYPPTWSANDGYMMYQGQAPHGNTAAGSSAVPSTNTEATTEVQAQAPRQLPSVEDFIPVLPKSCLNWALGGPSADEPEKSLDHVLGDLLKPPTQEDINGALIEFKPPKIIPEVERRAREARRAHISGFPQSVTKEQLMDYFRILLPEVRRNLIEREMKELIVAANDPDLIFEPIPPNARTDVDEIRDISINTAKSKPFGFIELSLADLITELVDLSQSNPEQLIFRSPIDGRSYTVTIRRPRDYQILEGSDPLKVVLTGFPPTLPEAKLRALFETHGDVTKFEMKSGLAYGEFTKEEDALNFRVDLHGTVLRDVVLMALPLYDWLKVVCLNADIDVTIHDEDPISGMALASNLAQGVLSVLDGPSDANALVVSDANAELDIMRDMLEMRAGVPDVVLRLVQFYPYLKPLYNNREVAIFPTRILVLLNLFDEEELILDSTYSQLVEDVEEEVTKYGCVEQLEIPRRTQRPRAPEAPRKDAFESPEELEAAQQAYEEAKLDFRKDLESFLQRQQHPVWGGYGRIFVVYKSIDEAALAQRSLAGRLFGGRTVITSFLFEDLMFPEEEEGEVDAENHGAQESEERLKIEATPGEAVNSSTEHDNNESTVDGLD